MATTKKGRKPIVIALIVVVVAALAVAVIYKRREAPITVQTEKVVRRNLT